VATPGARTIAEVSAFLGVPPSGTIKTLAFVDGGDLVLALVRGDHTIHERKLARALKREARPAHPEEIAGRLGTGPGSIGPVDARGVARILADRCLQEGAYVVGANREGVHLTGVRAGADFACEFADLQVALAGEGCPRCGKPLRIDRVIEVGNIFKLGTRFSEALGAVYLDADGQERPIVMGSYGIGPARIVAAAVEQGHDADGIVWPWPIAPFQVHVVPVGARGGVQAEAAEGLYGELEAAGFETLLDDRDERAGVKFKDADLLGVPIRVTLGNAYAKEGVVELRARATRAEQRVGRAEAVESVRRLAAELKGGDMPPAA
jgi:prolyl-tRNA synthetase